MNRLVRFKPIADTPSAANLMVSKSPVVNMFNLINASKRTLFIVLSMRQTESSAVEYSTECFIGATLTDFCLTNEHLFMN